MNELTPNAVTIGLKELAAMLGFSVETLYRRRTKGLILDPLACSGKRPRWSRAEVMRWIDAGSPPPKDWQRQARKGKHGH